MKPAIPANKPANSFIKLPMKRTMTFSSLIHLVNMKLPNSNVVQCCIDCHEMSCNYVVLFLSISYFSQRSEAITINIIIIIYRLASRNSDK